MSATTTKTDVAAKRAAARSKDDAAETSAAETPAPEASETATIHHIHFVADGFTTLGQVWYRGQEMKVTEGSDDWNRIAGRNGSTFFDVADDDEEQIARYGEVKFRPGAWPYQTFSAADIERMEREADRATDPEEATRLRKRAQRLANEVAPPGSSN